MTQLQQPRDASRPARDGAQTKTERSPERTQYDDERLLQLLQGAKRELQGLRLVHLHLSLLKDRNFSDVTAIKRAFQEIAKNSVFMQIFTLSNDDIIILYKGIKFSSISEVCQMIERLLLSRTQMVGLNPYKEDSLYSILELSLNFVNVMRFIEGLDLSGGADKIRTKPPIPLEELSKVERQLSILDLSPFMLNQPVLSIGEENIDSREYYELYIAIKSLEDKISPDYDVMANGWLFNHFTMNLDSSVLKTLNYGTDYMRGHRIGLNLNLTSIVSSSFVKFDERLTPELRSSVILEINKSDLVENERLYHDVVEFARQQGYKICIDGLTPFWVTHLDLDYLGADYAKIFWSPDMAEMSADEAEAFDERISGLKASRFILARCGTVASLLFANRHRIDLVQGRIVDHIVRKGVRLLDAIKTARVMDD